VFLERKILGRVYVSTMTSTCSSKQGSLPYCSYAPCSASRPRLPCSAGFLHLQPQTPDRPIHLHDPTSAVISAAYCPPHFACLPELLLHTPSNPCSHPLSKPHVRSLPCPPTQSHHFPQGEASLQFHAACGALSLEEEVKRIGPTANFTRLVPSLEGGQDPDDAFSRIPYEKGFYFLYYLQQLVGGPPAFEPFMRTYLQHFAYKTVTSDQFKAYFLDYFKDNGGGEWVSRLGVPCSYCRGWIGNHALCCSRYLPTRQGSVCTALYPHTSLQPCVLC
jgi:hypothetical protein